MEEKIEYRGFTINVYRDEFAENPLEYTSVATFVCDHPRYKLGHTHDIEAAVNRLFDKYISNRQVINYFVQSRHAVLMNNNDDEDYPYYYQWKEACSYSKTPITRYVDYNPDDEDEAAANMAEEFSIGDKLDMLEKCDDLLIETISAYEHGGIMLFLGTPSSRYSYGCLWDTGVLGFAYVERLTAKDDDWKERAQKAVEVEMRDYNAFLQGEVYGYYIEEDANGEEFDPGCGGYIGEDGYEEIIATAKRTIDYELDLKQ